MPCYRPLPALIGALMLLALAACGSGGTPATTSAQPAASAPQGASASAPSDQSPASGSAQSAAAPAATPIPRAFAKLTYPSAGLSALTTLTARDQGFFDRNGMDVEAFLLTSDRAMAAVASGEIHYVGGVGPASVAATALGMPLRAVWISSSNPAYTIFTQRDIRTPEQLRGKRMGVPALGGTSAVVSGLALKHYGLEIGRDVALLQLEGDRLILESLRSGVLDAAPLTAPQSLSARTDGFTPLVDVARLVQMPLGGLSATLDKINNEPAEVRRMVRALTEAQQWLLQNREEAIVMIQATLDSDRAIAEGTYEEVVPTMQGKGLVNREGIDNILQSVREGGRIGPEVRYEDVADGRFAEEVARELGLIS
jgi:NitT/TauT family transport system substrate-binding protein